jgi:hypothetical protein
VGLNEPLDDRQTQARPDWLNRAVVAGSVHEAFEEPSLYFRRDARTMVPDADRHQARRTLANSHFDWRVAWTKAIGIGQQVLEDLAQTAPVRARAVRLGSFIAAPLSCTASALVTAGTAALSA